jgi:hypothetical protein
MLLPSVPCVAANSAACVLTDDGSSQRVSFVPEKPHACKQGSSQLQPARLAHHMCSKKRVASAVPMQSQSNHGVQRRHDQYLGGGIAVGQVPGCDL